MSDKRISVSLTEEQLLEINALKKEQYYDKTYAELIRAVLQAGLESIKKGE